MMLELRQSIEKVGSFYYRESFFFLPPATNACGIRYLGSCGSRVVSNKAGSDVVSPAQIGIRYGYRNPQCTPCPGASVLR